MIHIDTAKEDLALTCETVHWYSQALRHYDDIFDLLVGHMLRRSTGSALVVRVKDPQVAAIPLSASPAQSTRTGADVTLGPESLPWLVDYDLQNDGSIAEGLVLTRIDIVLKRRTLMAHQCSLFVLLKYLIGRKVG